MIRAHHPRVADDVDATVRVDLSQGVRNDSTVADAVVAVKKTGMRLRRRDDMAGEEEEAFLGI